MFDDLPLPSSSSGEDLETLSRNRFRVRFRPERFEVRQEDERDKGIDLTVELKLDGKYTNFRFAVQLKSSRSVSKNTDDSVSHAIAVTNIGYLSNGALSAYYFLYDLQSDIFYYEELGEVTSKLGENYSGKTLPDQFTVRFTKVVDEVAINAIFESVLNYGRQLKQLRAHFHNTSRDGSASAIIIDNDRQMYSVADNMALIENYGYVLLTDGDFNRIIALEQRCYPRGATTARFDLVCGLAYFHRGKEVYRALELMLKAQKRAHELEPEMSAYLSFAILQAKHQIESLSGEQFDRETALLFEGDEIGAFLEIEKGWRVFKKRIDHASLAIGDLREAMASAIAKDQDDFRARILAYCRIAEAEFCVFNDDLSYNLYNATLIGSKDRFELIVREWKSLNAGVEKRLNDLMAYAVRGRDQQTVANLARVRILHDYIAVYLFTFYENWNFRSLSVSMVLRPDHKALLEQHSGFLYVSAQFFLGHGQSENLIHCLMLKYQLASLLGDEAETAALVSAIRSAIDEFDLPHMGRTFDMLLTQGTGHEQFIAEATLRMTNVYEMAKAEGSDQLMFNPKARKTWDDVPIISSIKKPFDFEFPEIKAPWLDHPKKSE